MKTWIGISLLLLLAGCAETTGVNKELPMRITQSGDNNRLEMNVSLQLESDTAGESGEARISPQTSASIYGPSQASGADALMDDLKYVIEKWMDNRKTDSDNTTTTNTTTPVVQPPVTEIDVKPLEVVEPNLDGFRVVARADCDSEMMFRDSSGESSVKQKKCIFDKPGYEYGGSFVVQWSSGNTLIVPNSRSMAWLIKREDGSKDYRKYQPQEPLEGGGFVPGTPAEVYAGRGDNSTWAQILVRE